MIVRFVEVLVVVALLVVGGSIAASQIEGVPPEWRERATRVLALTHVDRLIGLEAEAPDEAAQAGGRRGGAPAAGGEQARSGGAARGGGRGRGALAVTAAPVAIGPLQDRIQAIGTGRAGRSVIVTAPVPGTVASIDFTSGSLVAQGAVLLSLDREAEEIAIQRATAQFEAAQASAERYARLAQGNRTGIVSTAQVEETETALAVARAELSQARFEFDRRAVKAPFAGRVGLDDLATGQYVAAGAPLISLDDVDRLQVEFLVPEGKAGAIEPGGAVRTTTPSYAGRVFQGEIEAVDSRIDPNSRTLRVRATIANEERLLRPGMTFSVTVPITGEPVSVVPALAVQWSREGAYVWRLEGPPDGASVERVPIVIRKREGDAVFVEADLAETDLVAVEGAQKVTPGATVAVTEEGPPVPIPPPAAGPLGEAAAATVTPVVEPRT